MKCDGLGQRRSHPGVMARVLFCSTVFIPINPPLDIVSGIPAALINGLGSSTTASSQTPMPPPSQQPYNFKRGGLGKEATVVLVIASDCHPCIEAFPFFKKLLALPGMDGVQRRIVVIATDGVIPVRGTLDAQGFKPHQLLSTSLQSEAALNVSEVPTVIVLDGKGQRRGTWVGSLTTAQQKAVVAAIDAK